ncbi:hypothetical protein CRUP_032266 [Coryphaenoides rupestris]|nr:hypothetical protein CRUP_032266 [Coryphaenoides rupestris]
MAMTAPRKEDFAFWSTVLQNDRVQRLIEWAKDTYSPDEFLWATIQRMPDVPGSSMPDVKYDLTDINSLARLVKWEWHEGPVYPPCDGHHVRSICVYGVGDLRTLRGSGVLFPWCAAYSLCSKRSRRHTAELPLFLTLRRGPETEMWGLLSRRALPISTESSVLPTASSEESEPSLWSDDASLGGVVSFVL